ncbi:MAG: YIP1 family protein, partial [Eubacteriales bacterium]|nr:YIP1 family protein [Eubacteriales bacterium]
LINSDSVNFLESEVIKVETKPLPQNIVSLDVNKQGYIFALDKTVGLVYVYDSECNLISAFGGGIGYGVNLGQFTAAEALAVNDNNVLVIDSTKMSVTVFTLTDYGNLLQKAQSMYLKGDYYSAKPYWEEILKTDRGNQLAYRGLAVASQSVEDYTSALEYAKNGLDYQTYDAVWQTMVTGFLGRNFAWLLTAVLLSVLGIVLLGVKIKKRRKVLIQNPRIKVLTAVPFHPFTAFDDIKYKNQGSVKIAFIITIIFFLASVLQATATGFVFSRTDVRNYNVLVTIVQTVGIVALWTVGNWLVSSLFSGIGKLREIFIVTAYSLLPIICCIFIQVVLSHFLPLSGMPFFETLRIVALIYTFFLLCIGIMRVHEFNFFKFLGTGFVTLFSMIIVVFIMFMVVILLQQFWNFIYSIIMEIVYR